jgi:hypothetical protein
MIPFGGFYSYLASRNLPKGVGLFLLLSGEALKYKDLLELKLATHSLNTEGMRCFSDLVGNFNSNDIFRLCENILSTEYENPHMGSLRSEIQDRLGAIAVTFGTATSVKDLLKKMDTYEHADDFKVTRWVQGLAEKLRSDSPVAVLTTFRLFKETQAREDLPLEEALAFERHVLHKFMVILSTKKFSPIFFQYIANRRCVDWTSSYSCRPSFSYVELSRH